MVFSPTFAAACVAVTCIMDARHHGFDVLFGSALGILCACMAYRQYFPLTSHTWKRGHAYPMKCWGTPGDRAPPGKATLPDLEKLETLQHQSHHIPAMEHGKSFNYSTTTLNEGISDPRGLGLFFPGADSNDNSSFVSAEIQTSSDRASFSSTTSSVAAIKEPQDAHTVESPVLAIPYPLQIRKPVPAFHELPRWTETFTRRPFEVALEVLRGKS